MCLESFSKGLCYIYSMATRSGMHWMPPIACCIPGTTSQPTLGHHHFLKPWSVNGYMTVNVNNYLCVNSNCSMLKQWSVAC